MLIAVISPYCNESDATLSRCVESVHKQTVPCRHYLIADGFPNYSAYVEDAYRHIALYESHRDYGNTPRAIGALLAASEGADAIAFLDADNTYDPDHIETCLAVAQANPHLDYVIAKRRILLPDGTFVTDEEEPGHVDTSCFFLLRGAFVAIASQALLPKQLAIDGDRFFHKRLNMLVGTGTPKPTVNYVSQWAVHYEMAGLQPPSDAKYPKSASEMIAWWDALPRRDQSIVFRNLGYEFKFT